MDDPTAWLGRTETLDDEASLTLIRRLAALLDQDPYAHRRGDPVPEGWHAAFFGPLTRQPGLGPDGHAARGEFLPPIPLPRRMFAGRRTWFHAPIPIGAEIRRVSRITAITPKTGRSGPMVFVTVRHGIETAGPKGMIEAIVEEQDLVFRAESDPAAPPPALTPPVELPAGAERSSFIPDPTLLFRYSAVTNNGHRIHYDADYARTVEAYPALVVNGGITTTMLTELAKRHLAGPLTHIATRAGAPLFLGRTATLAAHAETPTRVKLWALNDQGRPAFEAIAETLPAGATAGSAPT